MGDCLFRLRLSNAGGKVCVFPIGVKGGIRKSEINADFLAGYFLGSRKLARKSLSFKAAGDLFDRLGSLAEGNPTRTHGNRAERLDAAEAGFRVAYVDRRDFQYAIKSGLEYVGL